MRVAEGLARTCYEMYARMPTGIAPEYVTFNKNGGGAGADFSPGASAGFYILRPETVESIFVLHQVAAPRCCAALRRGWMVLGARAAVAALGALLPRLLPAPA